MNALSSILLTLIGIVTLSSLKFSPNASLPISVTPSGIATSPPGQLYFVNTPSTIVKLLLLLLELNLAESTGSPGDEVFLDGMPVSDETSELSSAPAAENLLPPEENAAPGRAASR